MNYDPQQSRILIVDDTVKNLQVLGTILEQEGYHINVAQNGLQAIDIAEKALPNLILLDVMMPELDGFETCKRLKANDALADIPVIFLTARGESEDIVKGFDLGAVDYITKPFNASELLARVQTHLSIHMLQTALQHSLAENARMRREQESLLRHELKNRITPILGYSHMLLQNVEDEKQKRWASTIYNSSEDMADLIDTLKGLQDIESGSVALSKEPLELKLFLDAVADDLITAMGDQINIVIQGEDLTIPGDRNLLTGVFNNLIKNAVEHVIDLPDENQRLVNVQITKGVKQIIVSINNGGDPISSDNLEAFFEKFNTENKPNGTGLGTTYAALVTRAHGGDISVASTLEEGTTVTVILPV